MSNYKAYRRQVARQTKRRDDAEIQKTMQALAIMAVPTDVVSAVQSLTGGERSLRVPCGADALARRFLASRLIQAIVKRLDPDETTMCATLAISNASWQCPAHRPRMPLREIAEVAIKPLKKRFGHLAYAPTVVLAEPDGVLMMQPILRVLIFGVNLDEADVAYIDGVRRRLDSVSAPGSTDRTMFREVRRELLIDEIAHLLELKPRREPAIVGETAPSGRACTSSLMRVMVHATAPFKSIAGGTGLVKPALRAALAETKVWSSTREIKKPIIAANEIYPLLSEIPLELNGQRIRLPFWAL
jgi:hypothetical protein